MGLDGLSPHLPSVPRRDSENMRSDDAPPSQHSELGNGGISSMGRAPKRPASPLRPPGEHRQSRRRASDADEELAGPRRNDPSGVLQERAADITMEAGSGTRPIDDTEHNMPWQRRPSWMYLPHLEDLPPRARGPQGHRPEEHDPNAEHDLGAPHPTRGQDHLPGPITTDQPHRADGAGVAEIRGLPHQPRPKESCRRRRAQERLAARSAHLQRSFDDIADAVAKRARADHAAGVSSQRESVAARMAALRRRVAARAASKMHLEKTDEEAQDLAEARSAATSRTGDAERACRGRTRLPMQLRSGPGTPTDTTVRLAVLLSRALNSP